MACMEHECRKCGWATMDNSPSSPAVCPSCGSTEFYSSFDEAMDHDDHYGEDDRDDED